MASFTVEGEHGQGGIRLIKLAKGNPLFSGKSAHPSKRDLENMEFQMLNTRHFALEEDLAFMVKRIRIFLARAFGS